MISTFSGTAIRLLASASLLICGAVSASTTKRPERTSNGVTLTSSGTVTRIEVCSPRVVHVVHGPPGYAKPTVSAVIQPCKGTPFTTSSVGSAYRIQTGELNVELRTDTGVVRFFAADGGTILSEKNDDVNASAPQVGVQQEFLLQPGESLYGLGQHQEGVLNVRDLPIELLQANTNIAIPFLISTRGYGMLWDNPSLTYFNSPDSVVQLDEAGNGSLQTGPEGDYGFLLSGNNRDKLQLTVGGQKLLNLQNMWLPLSAGAKIHLAANTTYKVAAETGGHTKLAVRFPSKEMSFRSEAGEAVDYYFFSGPHPTDAIAEYRQFTGEVPLLPKWAYGFWQCRERYSSQQQILDTAAEFRNRKIPVDALIQDWQYWGKYGWNAMRFDEADYPDPSAMMSTLHKENLHLVISVWAKFGANTAIGHEMEDAHLVLKSPAITGEPGETKEQEKWADLFNPRAQKAFWSDIDRNLFKIGLDGWWLDASEPEGDPLRDDETFLGRGTGVRNAFPLFETSAVYQGERASTEDKRVVILSRSAYAGQQRNGTISWSGDISGNWETFRRQIPAGLGFGMSGFPYWTTDIGGFFRPADQYTSPDYQELLVRWFEFGTFCPIFRIHGFRSKTEMWNYSADTEKIMKQYDELRYRLLPYIYSSAWRVTASGGTMMQALPLVYPNDRLSGQVDDQFLFGDSLLINPVTEPRASARTVVLPANDNWVDFWTGKTYLGGRKIIEEAPLDRIPVLVKEGSILPLGPVVQASEESADPLEIRIYGGKDASFELYEDSGDGYGYEKGAKSIIEFQWNERHHVLSISDRAGSFPGMLPKRGFRVVLMQPGHGDAEMSTTVDRLLSYEGHALQVSFN